MIVSDYVDKYLKRELKEASKVSSLQLYKQVYMNRKKIKFFYSYVLFLSFVIFLQRFYKESSIVSHYSIHMADELSSYPDVVICPEVMMNPHHKADSQEINNGLFVNKTLDFNIYRTSSKIFPFIKSCFVGDKNCLNNIRYFKHPYNGKCIRLETSSFQHTLVNHNIKIELKRVELRTTYRKNFIGFQIALPQLGEQIFVPLDGHDSSFFLPNYRENLILYEEIEVKRENDCLEDNYMYGVDPENQRIISNYTQENCEAMEYQKFIFKKCGCYSHQYFLPDYRFRKLPIFCIDTMEVGDTLESFSGCFAKFKKLKPKFNCPDSCNIKKYFIRNIFNMLRANSTTGIQEVILKSVSVYKKVSIFYSNKHPFHFLRKFFLLLRFIFGAPVYFFAEVIEAIMALLVFFVTFLKIQKSLDKKQRRESMNYQKMIRSIVFK